LLKIYLQKAKFFMKEQYREIANEWLNKADSDLDYAEASFDEFDDFYSQMCILCHDAAEKYLKGYITSFGMKPERIHDLVTLLIKCKEILEDESEFDKIEESTRLLNRYYIPLKYPSHYPVMSREQAEEGIKAAKEIRDVIKKLINTE